MFPWSLYGTSPVEKMGPTCPPDRASPLGIGGTQSIGEPPKMRGAEASSLPCCPSPPFLAKPENKPCSPMSPQEKEGKPWPVFQRGWFIFLNVGFVVVVFFPFLGYSRNVSFCNSYFIVCNMFTRPFTIKTRGKDFCRLWKQQTNVITCFCFSSLFVTVMSPGPKSHDITLCLSACLSVHTLYKI